MSFTQPFWLWLLPVMWWVYWRWFRATGPHGALRLALLTLAGLVLAGPRIHLGGRGTDVVVVLDESLSVTEVERQGYRELVKQAEKHRRDGDRLGIVRFGGATRVEKRLEDEKLPGEWLDLGQQHRSDVRAGVETALRITPENRPARLVLVTDGELSRAATDEAGRLAATRRVPVDVCRVSKPAVRDVSVAELELPAEVAVGRPFQFTAWLQSSAPAEVTYELRRDRQAIARGTVTVGAGLRPVLLRDVLVTEGVHGYELVVSAPGEDRVADNNRARAVVSCRSGRKVTLVTRAPQGNMARVLDAFQIPHEVVTPDQAPAALALENLAGKLGVIIDNVNAQSIGPDGMRAVRQFVKTFGGGLMMTGGRESFGVGGYFNSVIEDCLPVTLEARKEIRKSRLSMAIAMDRSGSMSVPVPGGLQKMDLANNGAVEAIKMLGPLDRISVIAVDSAAHVIVPLAAVDDTGALIGKVRKIRSEGGGIFIYEALEAGFKQLQKADTQVRHMILFADAADSEMPGDYQKLLQTFRQQNMTVSVIGLGTEHDSDAALLKDIARLGEGRIFFTDRPEELPRLFSYETLLADRSAYVENPVSIQQSPAGLAVLSALPGELPAPAVAAYNLGYLKPQAQAAWVTKESKDDPTVLWGFGASGVGRSTALLFDVDGADGRALQTWSGFAGFLGATIRWTMAGKEPDATVELRRDGQDLVATLDMAGDLQQRLTAAPTLRIVTPQTGDEPQLLPLRQQADGTWSTRFAMEQNGFYHAVAHLGDAGIVRAAPVVLPYSAEYRYWEPTQTDERVQTLLEMTGGKLRNQWTDVFQLPRWKPVGVDLRPWLLVIMLVGWVVEISMRRLLYAQRWPARFAPKVKIPPAQPVAPAPVSPEPATPTPPPAPPPPPSATLDAMNKVKRKRQ
ncbi:MAG: hypothetical protein PCFJNLEI_03125 [Verrucomicrobiae bacterium]|nr:hypothetical protein [Verrucomicrobiae bacterium]